MVAKVRRLAGTKRVGHLGTLDPMAEGVLPLALGRATRLIEYVSGEKAYVAEITLGVTTTTLDAEGEVTQACDITAIDRAAVERALQVLARRTEQVPPMASALHHEGRRLYELFREGKVVELAARPVRIDRLVLADFAPPRAVVVVACGPGTYVRAIARDLGELLGCGAHLSALTRTRRGPFLLGAAVSLETLEHEGLQPWLLPPRQVVDRLPWLQLGESAVVDVRHGKRIALERVEDAAEAVLAASSASDGAEGECVSGGPGLGEDALCALADVRGELIAIARLRAGELQPLKVFAGVEGESS